MAVTAKNIPYPISTDNNAAHTDFLNLANKIDELLGGKTTAAINALAGADRWAGRMVFDTDIKQMKYWDGLTWSLLGPPVGSVIWFGGSGALAGYVDADGASLSTLTTYAALFAAIGTLHGTAGANLFNVPNLRSRTVFGYDVGNAAFNVVGETGGVTTITLTTANLAAHTHTGPSHNHTGPSHSHTGPSHTHGNGTLDVASGGGHDHVMTHNHTATSSNNTAMNLSPFEVIRLGTGGSSSLALAGGSQTINLNDLVVYTSHNHVITVNNFTGNTVAASAHTHSITGAMSAAGTGATGLDGTAVTGTSGTGATGSAGTDTAFTILNPYITLRPMIKF